MATKNNKKIFLYIGGAAIAGLALYEYFKNKNATAATSTTAAPAGGSIESVSTVTSSIPSVQGPISTGTTLPGGTISPSQPYNGIDPTVYGVVQKWAQADGRAPVLAMAAAMVPSEYEGMYELITNFWDTGTPPGQAQQDFWNNLRAEYDPTHQSW